MSNKLLFVISHQPNPRFIKQINYFSQNGFSVSVIYFHRDSLADLNSNIEKNVNLYLLDKIENGQYLKRILIYLKSLYKIKKLLLTIRPNKIITTNIDILFLLILNKVSKYTDDIIMEISDLRSYTFRNNLFSKLQQSLDDFLLDKYITKMIFTSPKFYDFYYKTKFQGKVFILENKPLKSMLPAKVNKKTNDKLVIGIVGLLLDGDPHKALYECVKERENIEVHIYGKGLYAEQAIEYAKKYQNIKYFGEYDFFKDISNIYASLDIIYMSYDTTKGDKNIVFALPNKLYEALYFQVPIITSQGTYLGEKVESMGVGITVKCCNIDEIITSIDYICQNKSQIKKNFNSLIIDDYFADNDYEKLKHFI